MFELEISIKKKTNQKCKNDKKKLLGIEIKFYLFLPVRNELATVQMNCVNTYMIGIYYMYRYVRHA